VLAATSRVVVASRHGVGGRHCTERNKIFSWHYSSRM